MTAAQLQPRIELPPCLSGTGSSYSTAGAARWVLLWARRQRRLRTPPRRAYRCAIGRHWHLTPRRPGRNVKTQKGHLN